MKKRTLIATFLCFALVSLFTTKSLAADTSYYDSLTEGTVDNDGYYIIKADSVKGIDTALQEAKEKATDKTPYKVVVKPSDSAYTLDRALILCSNVCLYSNGVTYKQDAKLINNMIRTDESETITGYYYKNIVIDGGVFDENDNGNTLAKLALAQNVTIKNATFKNVKKGHLMEIAGVNGITIDKCSFINQVIPDKGSKLYEAIQFDVIVKDHLKGYKFQDIANQNITITNCVFENVPRGVGSHTAVLNNPMKGVTIKNNKFSNIKSCAVQFINVEACTISDNSISDVPRAITVFGAIYDNQDTFLASTLASQGGIKTDTPTGYKTPADDMKIVISNNTISLSGKDPYASYERSGIWVSGYDAKNTTKNSSGDNIPKGNYYVSGIEITGNTIKGNSNGVKLENIRNCKVSDNTFDLEGSMSSTWYYGVALKKKCESVEIVNNTANKYMNGIYIKGSKADKIEGNTVNNAQKYGISIENAKASNINNNTVNNTKINGIYVKDSTAGNINNNKVNNSKKYGISIERSTATNISGNTVNKTVQNGIHIWDKSKVKAITNNSLKSVKVRGIYAGGKSKVDKITGNKFKSCKEKINIKKDSKAKKVQKV